MKNHYSRFIIFAFILTFTVSSAYAAWGNSNQQSSNNQNTSQNSNVRNDPFEDNPYFEDLAEFVKKMNKSVQKDLQNALDDMQTASNSSGDFSPRLDYSEKDEQYLVSIDLPGMSKDRIDVEMKGNLLKISGERNREDKTRDEDGFYKYERRFGSFSRELTLPEDANPDDVNAKYQEGVLEIEIGKREIIEEESKKVSIR